MRYGLLFFFCFIYNSLQAQMVLSSSSVSENFNSIGSSATANLPNGFRIAGGTSPVFSSGTTSTTQAGGTSGTGAMASNSTGGAYNFANGVNASSTDRAVGFLTSGSFSSPQNLMVQLQNNTGATITSLDITFDYEKYRTGTRAFDWTFFSSTNGSSWTAQTAGNQSYAADGGNAVVNPPTTISKSFTITGLNIAHGSSIYFRWAYTGSGGSTNGQGLGVDNITFTTVTSCTASKLIFSSQPTNTLQGNTIGSFNVAVACASNAVVTSCNNGNITLAFSGCGISGTLTRPVSNGVATFNNLVVSRSTQSNITFTATYSGTCGSLTNATSNAFNITSPVGAVTSIATQNFNGANSWDSYTPTAAGSGVFNTSNTAGVSSTSCLAFYYNDCLTDASGLASTVQFSEANLSSYSNIKFKFRLSTGGPQLAGSSCGTGTGVDTDDYIRLECRTNGGSWQTAFTMDGYGNYTYPWNSNSITLSHNNGSIIDINTEPSVFTVTLPAGVSSADFRFTLKNNRRHELWYIDDVILEGSSPGTPSPLPSVNAGNDFTGCPGGPNSLLASATNTIGTVTYSWSPSASLSNAGTANPSASNTVSTSYSVTVTDADGCTASDQVTVNVLNGTAGLWTGTLNTDWFNCKNWADGRVPTSATDVQIPNVTNDPLISASGAFCRNITVQAGANLSMDNSTSELQVYGSFTNNSGSVLGLTGTTGATVRFMGTGNTSITGTSTTSFQKLVVNRQSSTNITTFDINSGVTESLQVINGQCNISSGKIVNAELVDVNASTASITVKSGAILNVNP
ncbi:MAG: hypothetical protein SFW35_05520 [Chitinophagales bacterium]|nr:hypothetical protein [Chitinophagales bacterium]